MWNYKDDDKRMDDHDDDDALLGKEAEADIDVDREFKSVEEYVDEYD